MLLQKYLGQVIPLVFRQADGPAFEDVKGIGVFGVLLEALLQNNSVVVEFMLIPTFLLLFLS
jgi:hypothetical protein